jgi:hypothetical protein
MRLCGVDEPRGDLSAGDDRRVRAAVFAAIAVANCVTN